jgi:3-oxoadipate:acetyl-CoA acetyltransferase
MPNKILSDDLMLNFTPTGMIPMKSDTEYVPVSPEEIIEQVHEAYEIGITSVHVHARDADGKPTSSKLVYQKIFEGIRKHCPDLVLCASLSGRNVKEFGRRSEVLELYPDMGSLTLSSLNFVQHASVNEPTIIKELVQKMHDFGVHPELEVFDMGMVNYSKYLIRKGLLKPPYYFNLLFGNIAGLQVDLSHIGLTIKELPANSLYSIAGLGSDQLKANMIAIASGAGVRVGLEDNIYFDKNRNKLASNIDLVKRIHHIAGIMERKIMLSKDFGEMGFYNTKFRNGNT